eukprot:scaffold1763_cov243-Prasinococcus_capsulatus_cf.AAC.4
MRCDAMRRDAMRCGAARRASSLIRRRGDDDGEGAGRHHRVDRYGGTRGSLRAPAAPPLRCRCGGRPAMAPFNAPTHKYP